MKRHSMLTLIFTLMIAIGSLYATPQRPGKFKNCQGPSMDQPGPRMLERLPNVTDEQKEQLKAIRLDGMKQTMPLRNKIQELRAQLHTLQTKEAVNLKKVNALIDQIGDLKTQIMKIRAAHRQQIRALLTEEQRIIFDSMPHGQHKPGHQRPFMRKGRMQ